MPRSSRTGWSIWSLGVLFGPLILLFRARRAISDNSYLWHIVAGRVQAETGTVITTDPFSFTALGQPWRTQSWLADLLYAWAVGVGGVDVGRWIPVAVGSLTFLVLLTMVRQHLPVGLAMAIVSALTAVIALPFMNPRPVIFSYLLLSLAVLAASSKQMTWTLPLITWMWAAVHGSFFLVFVAVGLELVRSRRRRLVTAGVASALTALLTAHGAGTIGLLVEFARGNEALDLIQEWQPPDLLSLPLWPVLAGLVVFVAWVPKAHLDWGSGLYISAWFFFGLTANRSIPLMWIALLPVIAQSATTLNGRIRERSKLPVPVLALVGCATLALPLLMPLTLGLSEESFPVDASRFLTSARVFHGDGTGGYLIYATWPQRQVYIDDRAELFQDQYVRFAEVSNGRAIWQSEFERWSIDQALVEADSAIGNVLLAAGWQIRYEDDGFLVLDGPEL